MLAGMLVLPFGMQTVPHRPRVTLSSAVTFRSSGERNNVEAGITPISLSFDAKRTKIDPRKFGISDWVAHPKSRFTDPGMSFYA
jgi:hypothetical protein